MEAIIKEIAELIDSQEVVFLHQKTHEILSYPLADDEFADEEYDYIRVEVMEIVDLSPDDYLRFEPLDTRTSFQMMEDFIATITDERVKKRLIDAISIKKPFRNFRNAIEDEAMLDDWYAYKDAYLHMWVRDRMPE